MGEREPRGRHSAGDSLPSDEGLPTVRDDLGTIAEQHSLIPPDELVRMNQAAKALRVDREGRHDVFVATPPSLDEGLPTATALEDIPLPQRTD